VEKVIIQDMNTRTHSETMNQLIAMLDLELCAKKRQRRSEAAFLWFETNAKKEKGCGNVGFYGSLAWRVIRVS